MPEVLSHPCRDPAHSAAPRVPQQCAGPTAQRAGPTAHGGWVSLLQLPALLPSVCSRWDVEVQISLDHRGSAGSRQVSLSLHGGVREAQPSAHGRGWELGALHTGGAAGVVPSPA